MLAAVDYTQILTTLVATVPAIIAAIYAGRVHRAVQTPSGKSLGEVAEYAHDTAIANNLILSKQNGPTKELTSEAAHEAAQTPPRVPDSPTSPAEVA